MPVNYYFNNFQNSSEQYLIEDLVIESIRIYGHELYYLNRKIDSEDKLLNEDDTPIYDDAYQVEMYIKNVEGFEGEGDFLSRFGLQVRDSITFTIGMRVFEQDVGVFFNAARPMEGDAIYLPLTGKMYEIQHVEHESIFYQMGNLQVFDLRCELMEFSGQRFNTGYKFIDEIYEYTDLTRVGEVVKGEPLTVEDLDSIADNIVIETEGDNILDFSEENPFGENSF